MTDVTLALKLSKAVHNNCENVPHDIGLTLERIIQEHNVTTLITETDFFWEIDYHVTSCCKIGPITSENYCPNCGKKIVKP